MIHELVFHKIMDNYTALQNDFVTTYTFSFCQIIFFLHLKDGKESVNPSTTWQFHLSLKGVKKLVQCPT